MYGECFIALFVVIYLGWEGILLVVFGSTARALLDDLGEKIVETSTNTTVDASTQTEEQPQGGSADTDP
jgi:hypothetical protein